MTIEEIKLTAEETIMLERLKDDFNIRSKRSPAKKALRASEIKAYSLIFDEDNMPLPRELSDNDKPLKGYSTSEYCSRDIWLIREFWMHFIVEENDIAEIDKNEPDSWFWDLNDNFSEWLTEPRRYYSLAVIYCKYLNWLNQGKKEGITNSELALLAFYTGERISRGEKITNLYERFKYYESDYNRIGPTDSGIKKKNQIRLFERVIKKLSGNARIKAEKDLNELKKNIANDIYFDGYLKDLKK